jgi:WhiB family redox-sensing transcriptional regulator
MTGASRRRSAATRPFLDARGRGIVRAPARRGSRAAGGGIVALGRVGDAWQRQAACRGPEATLFYPPAVPEPRPEREARERRAKAICARCPVRAPCLEFALEIREPHGIWGGLNESERRALVERTG